jgi:membrane peptidoglycan carboxypeptidase
VAKNRLKSHARSRPASEIAPRRDQSVISSLAAALAAIQRHLQSRPRWLTTGVIATAVIVPSFLISSQMYLAYAAQLPDVSGLANDLPADTQIYAGDKTLLADLHPPGYQHYYERLSDMGTNLPDAIIAVEDRNFYQEPGVDPQGIVRAALADLKSGNTAQGASTITQQLVKIRLLGGDPTLQRKVTEALLAFAVEHRYSKSQILEMYLNSVSFGNTAVGTAAASQIYFHETTSRLDLAQASMLAGLIRGPTIYDPFTSWKSARERQHEVLDAMVSVGKITQPQADKAFNEDLSPPQHMFGPANKVIAPGFVSYVTGELIHSFGKGATYGGGLRVYTTLNTKLQDIGQNAISRTQADLAWRNVQQGALVAIDPTSGAITAMVSSANPSKDGGQYNLAVWPPRNPGSSMKLFTYTAAIAGGKFTMTTPIEDSPFQYVDPYTGAVYTPQNYDGSYHGTCQVQECLGNSLNIPAVKVELGTGVANVAQMARNMGAPPWQLHSDGSYTNDDPLNSFGPSLTLGGYGETPLQMATGAAVLAAQGVLHQPFAIARVDDRRGKTVYTHADNAKQVVDPKVAFIMATMLSRDENRSMIFGTNSALVIPGWHVAVKTGTSDSFADAWTVSFTPRIAVAVWMGNPDWRQKMTDGSDSYYVAVPAWNSFLSQALPMLGPDAWYAPPAGIVSAFGDYYLPGTVPPDAPAQPGGGPSGDGRGGGDSGGGHKHKH